MAAAADQPASAEEKAAKGATIGAYIDFAAAAFSLIPSPGGGTSEGGGKGGG